MGTRAIYKGYTFAGLSTPTESGRYRARVAIMAIDGSSTRSQRFIDLEVCRTEADANERAMKGAMAWIDANSGEDPLALPTNFAALDQQVQPVLRRQADGQGR